jgi:uncharacterized membrane protein
MSPRPARRGIAPVGAGTPATPAPMRIVGVDALRGIAILAMIAYHFAFDLRFYGVVAWDFEHGPFWLTARTLIAGTFLAIAGVGLVLADRAGSPPAHFWKRVGVIAACALAASVGSYLIFPRTFIYFGILHCIAAASVLAWPLVRRPRFALLAGIVVIGAGLLYSNVAFNDRLMSMLGFMTFKPPTEDYVPLFPWAGALLIGIAAGHWLAMMDFRPLARLARCPRWLERAGRHSLAIYMVHQPVLLGALWFFLGR